MTNNNNDDNDDNNDDDGVNLDALCRRIRDLRRMLDASANRLANAKADTAVMPVKCARTLELAKRRAGERICQVKEELRRTRIKAERFRAGWTRLRAAVGGRGGKRRAKGALASLSAAAAAKADDAPPSPLRFGGRVGCPLFPLRPLPPLRCRQSSSSQRTRGGIVIGEGFYGDSMVYAGIRIRGLVAGQRRSNLEVDNDNVPAGSYGGG
jgi:hypothetical protein